MFKRRGSNFQNEQWIYNGNMIEVVDHFDCMYLAFVISTNRTFNEGIDTSAAKRCTFMGSLLHLTWGMDVPIDINLKLFVACICEVNAFLFHRSMGLY